jgi:hypothetical protein
MNPPAAPPEPAGLARELQSFRALCEEALDLVNREGQALAGANDFRPGEFNEQRKRLLPQLDSALIQFRTLRQSRRQPGPPADLVGLSQTIQSLLMKVLLRDRENQQALLRRGLVPAQHWPPATAQQPHYVSGLYQRHARGGGMAPG